MGFQRQCTALHLAAMSGFTCCAQLLLEAGAVVNAQDKVSRAVLSTAIIKARVDWT